MPALWFWSLGPLCSASCPYCTPAAGPALFLWLAVKTLCHPALSSVVSISCHWEESLSVVERALNLESRDMGLAIHCWSLQHGTALPASLRPVPCFRLGLLWVLDELMRMDVHNMVAWPVQALSGFSLFFAPYDKINGKNTMLPLVAYDFRRDYWTLICIKWPRW